jgi:hypothetical protein
MPLIPLDIPPGVLANGQPFQVGQQGRWHRANLVRWQDGLLKPVGGWTKLADGITGCARALHAWRDNTLRRYLGIGTTTGLYVYTDSGSIQDVTPTGFLAGRCDAIYGAGYGFGPYGAEAYGTVRTSDTNVLDATTWALDNWGENLIAVANHEGKIYEWVPGNAEAAQITNSPEGIRAAFVSSERHLVALSGRTVYWSDREDNTDWTASTLNQAGQFDLQTTGSLRAGVKVRGQSLLLSDQDAHTMTFIGSPLVYSFAVAGTGCGVFGAQAVATTDSFAVWMGPGGFYIFQGTVQSLPSDVRDYVFSDINLDQASKTHAALNDKFNEIWWFYPSADSTEIDRYVIWNYVENHWSIGELSRLAWEASGVFRQPLAVDASGNLYQHETGWTADGAPLNGSRYAESGSVSLGVVDQVASLMQMIPDERSLGDTQVRFNTRFYPNGGETAYGPYTLSALTDLRFQAREISARIEGVSDSDWRIGLPRFDVVAGGRR